MAREEPAKELASLKRENKRLAGMLMHETGPTVDRSIKGVVEQAIRLLKHYKDQETSLLEQNEALRKNRHK